MPVRLETDLCIIGAGPGGLSLAAGAAQIGASVVLVEEGQMGGDCLNYGCVPSKALIAAAKAAQAHRNSTRFGVAAHEPEIDYAAVMGHVQAAIATIAPHDSVERFEGLGVRVLRARGRFTGPREVAAGDHRIVARRFVIATGSSPTVPPIPGLDAVPYLTNETLWENRDRPEHLIVIGGGPIGIELAQAHRRLGCRVTVVEAARALGREDPEIAGVALDRLRAEGVSIREEAKVISVDRVPAGISLSLAGGETIIGSHVLVAAGRRPNVEDLGLDDAGVASDRAGVRVDRGLRSLSNRHVYAIGDAAGGLQFTHVAGYHAGLVLRNALFRLPVSVRTDHIPRVTFTDPELAHAGLTEAEARNRYGSAVEIHRFPFAGCDRAVAEGHEAGLVKVITGRRGRILGCSIAGASAGELIHPWALALASGLGVKAMAGYVAPYPTLGEAGKRAAGGYFALRLFGRPSIRRLVGLLARIG